MRNPPRPAPNLTDEQIAAELNQLGINPATMPAAVRRPVLLGKQLVDGIVDNVGWAFTPQLVTVLCARRTPLGTPDVGDVIALPQYIEHAEGAHNAGDAMRSLVARWRPSIPAGRVFYGITATAQMLNVDDDTVDTLTLWEGRTPAEVDDLTADLIAAGRAKQTIIAVGALANDWRLQVSRQRHGGTGVAVFEPGEPWPNPHDFAAAVMEATLAVAGTV